MKGAGRGGAGIKASEAGKTEAPRVYHIYIYKVLTPLRYVISESRLF